MISEFDLAKALRDRLKAVTTETVVSIDSDFTPKPNETYIVESVVNGETVITIDPNGSNSMRGFYEVKIYTPISKKKWFIAKLVDDIKSGWPKGFQSNIVHNGQKVSIENVDTSPLMKNETHLYRVLSVYFTVIG